MSGYTRTFAAADDMLDSLIAWVRERAPVTTADIASDVLEMTDDARQLFEAEADADIVVTGIPAPRSADVLAALLATAVQRLAQEQS
jgi:hypothetical protein